MVLFEGKPARWIEVEVSFGENNSRYFRKGLRLGVGWLSVVKATANRHGLAGMAIMAGIEARWVAVHRDLEALCLFGMDHCLVRANIPGCGRRVLRGTCKWWMSHNDDPGFELWPVLDRSTTVLQIQSVDSRETIGYGRTKAARRWCCLVVIPVVFADGYSSCPGKSSRVLIGGRFAQIEGRVWTVFVMDDVRDILQVGLGIEAVFTVARGGERFGCKEFERSHETIIHEFLGRPSPEVRRAAA